MRSYVILENNGSWKIFQSNVLEYENIPNTELNEWA